VSGFPSPRRPVHATALDAVPPLPSFEPYERIHLISLLLHHGRQMPCQHIDRLAHPYLALCQSPPWLVLWGGAHIALQQGQRRQCHMLSLSRIRGWHHGPLKQAQNSHRRGRHDRVISVTSAAGRLKSESHAHLLLSAVLGIRGPCGTLSS